MISQDLDELFEVCDAMAVMHDGELSEPIPREQATLETIGLLMGGASAESTASSTSTEKEMESSRSRHLMT